VPIEIGAEHLRLVRISFVDEMQSMQGEGLSQTGDIVRIVEVLAWSGHNQRSQTVSYSKSGS
jgi:hypothetical protein